ncbi:hypothetical protein PS862_04529 [Pseudomonas fluorescens]|uniref:Uncharacterized protein n=1 Tax=Pseudomonas fluorescens TaxID=294 RepID=A0A5E7NB69_PSEFL|nr:hypothetical protein [Pseudomonas fluorescens]VVP34129.1 hypothetical protein PS862_04529 [Pseudomonas fluorescens]
MSLAAQTFPCAGPTIYLGDRGFLKRYASPYSNTEIEAWARVVLNGSRLGVASGDGASAAAVGRAINGSFSPWHLYHSRFLIQVYDKLSGKLFNVNEIQREPQRFYEPAHYRFGPDVDQIDEDIDIINRFNPGVVSVGGDWLDILLAQGEIELIEQIFHQITSRTKSARVCWLMLTFNLSERCLKLLDRMTFDGVLTAANILQMDCVITTSKLEAIKQRCPLYALHCLAGGVIPLEPALDYALNHMGVAACIVGAGRPTHIVDLMRCEALYRRHR